MHECLYSGTDEKINLTEYIFIGPAILTQQGPAILTQQGVNIRRMLFYVVSEHIFQFEIPSYTVC